MKKLSLVLAFLMLFTLFAGCAKEDGNADNTQATQGSQIELAEDNFSETASDDKSDISVLTLKGPTGMGMSYIMSRDAYNKCEYDYNFTLAAAPEELTASIIQGDFDIAAIPANLASVLYQKTGKSIKCAAVNTLGVLYILENGNTINSVDDLKGKTIYASGQGATPEYVLRYVLSENGIDPDSDVTIEYCTEHSELAAKLIANEAAIGMLPEPNVSNVIIKNSSIRIALDMTEEWDKIAEEGSTLVQGCLIVNSAFAGENPEALKAFIDEYRNSVDYVNNNTKEAALLCSTYGITPSSQIAEKALPNCNIVYIDGNEMKNALNGTLNVLFDAQPASVGGELPDENFWLIT